MSLRGGDIWEQAIEFLLDDLVALAHPLLQARPVQHLDVAATISNQSRLLQFLCSLRYAFATNAQHVSN